LLRGVVWMRATYQVGEGEEARARRRQDEQALPGCSRPVNPGLQRTDRDAHEGRRLCHGIRGSGTGIDATVEGSHAGNTPRELLVTRGSAVLLAKDRAGRADAAHSTHRLRVRLTAPCTGRSSCSAIRRASGWPGGARRRCTIAGCTARPLHTRRWSGKAGPTSGSGTPRRLRISSRRDSNPSGSRSRADRSGTRSSRRTGTRLRCRS